MKPPSQCSGRIITRCTAAIVCGQHVVVYFVLWPYGRQAKNDVSCRTLPHAAVIVLVSAYISRRSKAYSSWDLSCLQVSI